MDEEEAKQAEVKNLLKTPESFMKAADGLLQNVTQKKDHFELQNVMYSKDEDQVCFTNFGFDLGFTQVIEKFVKHINFEILMIDEVGFYNQKELEIKEKINLKSEAKDVNVQILPENRSDVNRLTFYECAWSEEGFIKIANLKEANFKAIVIAFCKFDPIICEMTQIYRLQARETSTIGLFKMYKWENLESMTLNLVGMKDRTSMTWLWKHIIEYFPNLKVFDSNVMFSSVFRAHGYPIEMQFLGSQCRKEVCFLPTPTKLSDLNPKTWFYLSIPRKLIQGRVGMKSLFAAFAGADEIHVIQLDSDKVKKKKKVTEDEDEDMEDDMEVYAFNMRGIRGSTIEKQPKWCLDKYNL